MPPRPPGAQSSSPPERPLPEPDEPEPELSSPEPGGSVRVCFGAECGSATISAVDGTADEAEIAFADLGAWDQDRSRSVKVSVRDASGAEVATGEVTPSKATNCCGDYWTVRL